jgi:hypothetical protein
VPGLLLGMAGGPGTRHPSSSRKEGHEVTEIVKVPFHGDVVLTVEHNGKPHVILKPAFEAIGLQSDHQIAKVKRQPWATTRVTQVVAADGTLREMVTADVRTFLMALATIPAARVAEHVRPKLIEYQSEVADVIEQYWTKGQVINPRMVAGSIYEPHTLTWDEVCAVMRQRYGLPLTINELCRMLRTAGVLKQTGAPTKRYQHLFWFTGTAWNVHPHVMPEIVVKVVNTGRELQDFRFIQARLQLDGIGLAEVEGVTL